MSSRYKNARLVVYQPFILRPYYTAFCNISYDRIILSLLADAVAVAVVPVDIVPISMFALMLDQLAYISPITIHVSCTSKWMID